MSDARTTTDPAMKGTTMIPANRAPTPPGEMLLKEFLEPSGMTQAEAARRMEIPLNRLNEIIKGKRGITADTAWRLSALFDTTPESWMTLQVNHDLYRARRVPMPRRVAAGARFGPARRAKNLMRPISAARRGQRGGKPESKPR
jgi:addiction module HigA family antidote